jgi:4-aminobutyrate aminotransferase
MSRTGEIIDKDETFVSPSMRIPFYPTAIRTGHGAEIVDWEGRTYIDFLSAAAISNVGHQHPRVVAAIQEQAGELIHYNTAYAYHRPLAELGPILCRITPVPSPKQVALGLSGADANDGAIKLSRASTGRQKVLAFIGSYHGSTYGALSLSSASAAMRRGFGPFLPEVYHVPYPDCYRCAWGAQEADCHLACFQQFESVLAKLAPAEEVAAVIMEPIQGDAGVIVPPRPYMTRIANTCREHGVLFVAEEVQTGMGRTGEWFASELFGLTPDAILIGKAIASGMPLSALVARADLMDHWSAPAHVFATGANPVCCAAAQATVAVMEEEHLVERARRLGAYLKDGLKSLMDRHEVIGDVRGAGMMLGVDLVKDRETRERARETTAKVSWRCCEKGLFLTFFAGSVLRICPPLVVTQDQIDTALTILDESFDDVLAGKVDDSVLGSAMGW